MAHSSRGCTCCCILLLLLITQSHTIQPNGVEPEGCNGVVHGITCCSEGFTTGDNGGKQEIFIQANQYTATCANSCKQYGHSKSVGITESLRHRYSSGPGKNKNKCWCEYGKPKLNAKNKDYRTCMFKLPLVSPGGIATKVSATMPPKSLMVSSNGSAATEQSDKLGRYELQNEFRNNFPVWKKEEGELYLSVSKKQHWAVGPNHFSFGILNYEDNPTPLFPHLAVGWMYFDGLDWKDDTIQVSVELELRGGSTAKEGNVYALNSNNTLVPVCDFGWHHPHARVVCRQLGYPDGVHTRKSHFGPVRGDSGWEIIKPVCYGGEARIQECKWRNGWSGPCTNEDGAGVICFGTTGPVILDGGASPSEGNVYSIDSEGILGPVCDDNWGNADARVVCRQLGYVDGTATKESFFGSVLDDFTMDNVNCQGDEAHLQDCRYSKWDDCYGDEAAGVKCSNVTLDHSDEIIVKKETEIDLGCSSTQFACADGLRCIRAEFTCDKKPDCDDGSDEISHLCMGCDSTQFPCPYIKNSIPKCIPAEDKCNGRKDCLNYADEYPSECGGCKPTMFACANDKQCIPGEQKCDGSKNCRDGSDELRSMCGDCDSKEFACANGWQCVNSHETCNGHRHCEDGSDEFPSLCGPCDNSTQFACAGGLQCILIENKCKGRTYGWEECKDGSDKIASTCGCKPEEFMCADGSRCIGAEEKCNQKLNCQDASDELPSLCGGCKSEEFTCANGWQCIGAPFKCDGVKDCKDGSDEFAESPSECGVPERRPAYSFHPNASAEYANYVELRGGDAPNKGNVFVADYKWRKFGPVCGEWWNYDEAYVVCRQLGYSDGIPHLDSLFGPVNPGKIMVMNTVQCERSGYQTDKHIQECDHSEWIMEERCGSSNGVGVTCVDDEVILLVGGSSSSEGNVYAKNARGHLGSVCDDGWGDEEARVACRQLGYGSGVAAKYPGIGFDTRKTFGWKDVREGYVFSMANVNCGGNEQRIQDCETGPTINCPSNAVAGVKCNN